MSATTFLFASFGRYYFSIYITCLPLFLSAQKWFISWILQSRFRKLASFSQNFQWI